MLENITSCENFQSFIASIQYSHIRIHNGFFFVKKYSLYLFFMLFLNSKHFFFWKLQNQKVSLYICLFTHTPYADNLFKEDHNFYILIFFDKLIEAMDRRKLIRNYIRIFSLNRFSDKLQIHFSFNFFWISVYELFN